MKMLEEYRARLQRKLMAARRTGSGMPEHRDRYLIYGRCPEGGNES
jgi:hypothetical protein